MMKEKRVLITQEDVQYEVNNGDQTGGYMPIDRISQSYKLRVRCSAGTD